jgi:hypothetical protein
LKGKAMMFPAPGGGSAVAQLTAGPASAGLLP